MSIDKEQLANLVRSMLQSCGSGYNGMSVATMKGYLPQLTELLNCSKNKHWRKVCFDLDNQNAQSYLHLTPKELIHYNGMSLKTWKEEDITRKDVLIALHSSWHQLTPNTIYTNKKIRKHLTDKDIIHLAFEYPYYVHNYRHTCYTLLNPFWLECLRKPLPTLKTFNDWKDQLGIVYWFLPREDYKHFANKLELLKKLHAPEDVIQYASQLCSFALRYTAVNPDRDYCKKEAVSLSCDINENIEFEVYLKMKGIDWHKEWSRNLDHEQHYQDNLFALNECLIAKYSNNKRKEKVL